MGLRIVIGLALVVSGCSERGRPDLGPAEDSGPGVVDAGVRADAPVEVRDSAAGELCDEVDDDADGSIDEGCACDAVGTDRPCAGAPPACGSRIQRCVNAGEFGTVWMTCELITPPGGCEADAGTPEPDAGPVVPPLPPGPPGECGRAGSTGDARDVCWQPAAIGVDAMCPRAGGAWQRFDPRQGLWIGVVECAGPMGFRFFLKDPAFGDWRPATDGAGHSQDICELVDPTFRIPDEDDITSGGCASCTAGGLVFSRGPVYARYRFGECFMEEVAEMDWPWLTSVVYCGLSGSDLEAAGAACLAGI